MIQQIPLFSDMVFNAPSTEGVKYTGSKLKLLPYILQLIKKVNAKTVLDGFSGTTRVSQALAKSGYKVICNDIAVWSEVLATCYLLNNAKPQAYKELIQHLNALSPKDGWFTLNYGGLPNDGSSVQADGLKKPWQIHNTRKLDAIREEIDRLSLSILERAVALTSLILALDRVDNTLGHFVSYLQDWSPRSYNQLTLKVPSAFHTNEEHQVFRRDIFDLVPTVAVDLAYFDPPYGSNNDKMPPSRVRYASYYHIWTTICLNDQPQLVGKAKRRADVSDVDASSIFEEFRKGKSGKYLVYEALHNLIRTTRSRYILLSYNNNGRVTPDEIIKLVNSLELKYELLCVDYSRNVMSSMSWTNEWTNDKFKKNVEFLFLLEKQTP